MDMDAREQPSAAHETLLEMAPAAAGERVLDVACGTGLVGLVAALNVGDAGRVIGIDASEQMLAVASRRAADFGIMNARFGRMDGRHLSLPDADFDLVYCALGLMYMPDPGLALREIHRVLRPGGRLAVAVWGERGKCGWSAVFPIAGAEAPGEAFLPFFQLGEKGALLQACGDAGFIHMRTRRVDAWMQYDDDDEACAAVFARGPATRAWSRFDQKTRRRVRARYLQEIARWRDGNGYRIPVEFVLLTARAAGTQEAPLGPHAHQ